MLYFENKSRNMSINADTKLYKLHNSTINTLHYCIIYGIMYLKLLFLSYKLALVKQTVEVLLVSNKKEKEQKI